MGTSETTFTNKVVKWLKKTYGCKVIKFHGNAFTEIGVTDLIIAHEQQAIFIEIKVGKNTPSPHQQRWMDNINNRGHGLAFWITDAEDWKKVIQNKMV